jgi:Flp pilus assembly protein TadG
MWRVNRASRDRGAAAIIVVVLFSSTVLVGVAALTVDVGQWMAERRILQNGADAAALSLVKTCGSNVANCSWSVAATSNGLTSLNNANAGSDQLSGFMASAAYPDGICQKNFTGASMPTCDPSTSTDCLPLPAWVTSSTKYVEAHTRTSTSSGTKVPPVFGAALGENDGGKTIGACARAALLPVSGGVVVPLAFSRCEWDNYVPNDNRIVPGPPYTGAPPYPSDPLTYGNFPTYEHTIYLHDTSGSAHCNAGPSGADLPGGFGWLDPTAGFGCHTVLDSNSYVPTSTGNSIPNPCDLSTLRNTVVLIPIYNELTGTGNNITYHIWKFAAFYITGYWAPSAANRVPSSATGLTCLNSQTCLFGWFTSGLIDAGEVDYNPGASSTGAFTPAVAG